MKKITSEKLQVENPCAKWANDRKIKHKKLDGLGSVGWPDRMFFLPGGRPLLIEFKKPGEKPTLIQAKVIQELREFGYDVEVCDSKEQGIACIAARLADAGYKMDTGKVPASRNKVVAGVRGRGPATRPRSR